jgi:hypothetical protein
MASLSRTWQRVTRNDQLLLFLRVSGPRGCRLQGPVLPPTARDLVHRIPTALVPEDDLETALELVRSQEGHIPVVDDAEDMHVIGEVRYQDLVLAYNRALLAARAAERGES